MIVCLTIVAGSVFGAENWTFYERNYLAFDSSFEEYPDPKISNRDFIWGNFDTMFFEAGAKANVFAGILVGIRYNYGIILSNRMFLDDIDTYLTIGGFTHSFDISIGYRILQTDRSTLDVFAGFRYAYAMKNFRDYTKNGSVQMPGNFGNYVIHMFGPLVGIELKAPVFDYIGIRTTLVWDPYFENKTVVTGWTPQPIQESATGSRVALDAAIVGEISGFQLDLGYSYESVLFNYGLYATHSLGYVYAGPYLRFSFGF